MPKKTAAKPPVVWKQFVLFWWIQAPGNRMGTYRTRQPGDIEVFGPKHYRMRFHPDSVEDYQIEVIIRHHKGEWLAKLEDDEEFLFVYGRDDYYSIWTWIDDTNQELFTIRGELKD